MVTIARGGVDWRGRRRLVVWGGAAVLMAAPVLALQLTDNAPADPGDFVFLAILLIGVGGAYELAARVDARRAYRAGVGAALLAALLQTWLNLAVGVIGSEDNPANLLYAGVLATAALGAAIARFRPEGMARAMTFAAAAQVAAFAAALVVGLGFTGPITVFFTALWLLSAWLFRRAAQADRAPPPPSASGPGRRRGRLHRLSSH